MNSLHLSKAHAFIALTLFILSLIAFVSSPQTSIAQANQVIGEKKLLVIRVIEWTIQ
jgi:hypothetical protein